MQHMLYAMRQFVHQGDHHLRQLSVRGYRLPTQLYSHSHNHMYLEASTNGRAFINTSRIVNAKHSIRQPFTPRFPSSTTEHYPRYVSPRILTMAKVTIIQITRQAPLPLSMYVGSRRNVRVSPPT